MPQPKRLPVIFLAFANDRDDQARYLHDLPGELRDVRAAIERAEEAGICEVEVRTNVTISEIVNVFQSAQYRDRIAIFHYGGHAGGYGLLLEAADGSPELARSEGLAAFFAEQSGLQLVFLNGCSTEPQVEGLLEAGVRAVVATAESIRDDVARALAARFYAGLASGAGLDRAYKEAVAEAKAKGHGPQSRGEGGPATTRAAIVTGVPSATRWPWELYVGPGWDAILEWSLPVAAGDPLFGLPPLPRADLPETPFRYLRWFDREHAEVFFGRGREIRELYELVTSQSAAPILLFYGQSGIGKSSLLAAGVLPRLEATHEVQYVRRDTDIGLAGTLAGAVGLGQTEESGALAEAWLAAEAKAGRPLTVILDQVEEAYTREGGPREELDAFLDLIATCFRDPMSRPRGKLVLGFRKEWLAELEQRLRANGLPRSKFYLGRLDRDGVIEIVDGPGSTERLRQQFRLEVEPKVGALIADDLLEDPDAPVAPTLQILLSKMWNRALDEDAEAPRFTVDAYQSLRREGLLLDDFLDEQLEAIRVWKPEIVDSGLALDLLAFHTTSLGTAERRTHGELDAAYAHRIDDLPSFIEKMRNLYLLVDHRSQGSEVQANATRLAHDTLAPLVRQRFTDSDQPGQRARRILDSRVADWADNSEGKPLDQYDLLTIEAGANGTRAWSADETRLVEASRRRRDRSRRMRGMLTGAGAVAATLIIGLSLWGIAMANRAEKRAAESLSRSLAAAAGTALQNGQVSQASLLAVQAFRVSPTFEARSRMLANLQRADPRLSITLVGHLGSASSVAFSPDGRTLASAGRELILWDLATRQPIGDPLEGHTPFVNSVAFSPDGRTLASASDDRTIIVWDLATRQPIAGPLEGHTGPVYSVVFSPDGRTLASASADGTIIVWDLAIRRPIGDPLEGHTDSVWRVAFSPDGRTLASASDDRTIILWDLATRQPIGDPLEGHTGSVYSVALSPDGRILASGGRRELILWDLATRQPIDDPLEGHTSSVWRVAFSPDGRTLASTSADGTIIVWNLATPTPIGDSLERTRLVYGVAFSPDGRTLASGGGDGIILWDLATRQPIGDPLQTSDVNSVAFSPDGRTLASGGWELILWNTDHVSWANRHCDTVSRNLSEVEWSRFVPDQPYQCTCPDLPPGQDSGLPKCPER